MPPLCEPSARSPCAGCVTIDELDGSGISLAALSSAALAAAYTFLTYRLVRSQTEPHVVVYVHHDESR